MLIVVGAVAFVVSRIETHAPNAAADSPSIATTVRFVQRRSLTAQQPITGTLGYADAWTVAVPAGTSAAELEQVSEQYTSARSAYVTTQETLAADRQELATVEAELGAARLKEASDCQGANAASATAVPTSTESAAPAVAPVASTCAGSIQAAQSAQAVLPASRQKLAADQAQVAAARSAFIGARKALDSVQSVSAAYGAAATYTMLPSLGDVITRGEPLYSINGLSTLLLYGASPAWRTLAPGVRPGNDVAQLNANLRALGFDVNAAAETFTSSTELAVKDVQRQRGLPVTGTLSLGSVVFEPGAVRVTAVAPEVGQPVQSGSVLTLSSTRHAVTMQLDVSQQSQVNVGDHVLISLPNNRTTPGVVASVGKVASVQSQGSGNAIPGSPSIAVQVRLLHPTDAGTLDQAPVNVLITTGTVQNVLAVPVTALVALAGGGYAIEVVTDDHSRRLVTVTPGLFDDQKGLVEVNGPHVVAGQRVVVPAS